ncbi:CvpA family protein, partial [Pseudomonas yamanorum]
VFCSNTVVGGGPRPGRASGISVPADLPFKEHLLPAKTPQ